MAGIEAGRIKVIRRDTTEPSVLAHEILNGMPYTYLDDETEAGNRRSRQVQLPRGLPVEARDLARLDPAAIERVAEQVRPQPRDLDELHDLLMTLYVMRPVAVVAIVVRGAGGRGRAGEVRWRRRTGAVVCGRTARRCLLALFPGRSPGLAGGLRRSRAMEPEAVAAEMLRGHLDVSGPCTAAGLARATGLGVSARVAGAGQAGDGGVRAAGPLHRPGRGGEEWCARRVLTRIHAYTRQRKRREVEPVTAQDFMRFLLRWQHVTPDTRREGSRGVLAVVEQLQGFELAAGRLGEGHPAGPGDRLPQGMAGRGGPGRRGRLGAAVTGCATSETRRARPAGG